MLPLPGGAGLAPVLNEARRLSDFTLPAGTFKRFDLEQVVRLLLDVLSGLAALHEVEHEGAAFVHGEVAPQNVYVDEHGTARLVPLLSSHLMVGARPERNGYVAPERLLGDDVDVRADVFSVGAMLWEALSGQRLFPDPTPDGVIARLVGRKVPPIELSPRLAWAKPLCRIAERAISVEPKSRFGSALELANAVAAAAAQQLSTVDTDAWQEEAPTPVFQPGLHLSTRRAVTPQPQVIDIPGRSTSSAPPAPPSPSARAPLPTLEEPTLVMVTKEASARVLETSDERSLVDASAGEPVAAWRSSRRRRGVVLGALALALAAVAVAAPRAPGLLQHVRAHAGAAALWLGAPRGSGESSTGHAAVAPSAFELAPPVAHAEALEPAPPAAHAEALEPAPSIESAPAAPSSSSSAVPSSSAAPSGSAAPSARVVKGRPPVTLKAPSAPGRAAPAQASPPAAKVRSKSSEANADYGI